MAPSLCLTLWRDKQEGTVETTQLNQVSKSQTLRSVYSSISGSNNPMINRKLFMPAFVFDKGDWDLISFVARAKCSWLEAFSSSIDRPRNPTTATFILTQIHNLAEHQYIYTIKGQTSSTQDQWKIADKMCSCSILFPFAIQKHTIRRPKLFDQTGREQNMLFLCHMGLLFLRFLGCQGKPFTACLT